MREIFPKKKKISLLVKFLETSFADVSYSPTLFYFSLIEKSFIFSAHVIGSLMTS